MPQLGRALKAKAQRKKGFAGFLDKTEKGFLALPGPRATIALGKTAFNIGGTFASIFEGAARVTGTGFGSILIIIVVAVVGLIAFRFLL